MQVTGRGEGSARGCVTATLVPTYGTGPFLGPAWLLVGIRRETLSPWAFSFICPSKGQWAGLEGPFGGLCCGLDEIRVALLPPNAIMFTTQESMGKSGKSAFPKTDGSPLAMAARREGLKSKKKAHPLIRDPHVRGSTSIDTPGQGTSSLDISFNCSLGVIPRMIARIRHNRRHQVCPFLWCKSPTMADRKLLEPEVTGWAQCAPLMVFGT